MQEFPMIIVLMNEIAFDSEHDANNMQSFRQAPYQSQHPLWLCEWAGRSVFIVVGGWKVYNFIQSAPEKVFAFNLVLLTFLSLYLSYCIYPSSWYRDAIMGGAYSSSAHGVPNKQFHIRITNSECQLLMSLKLLRYMPCLLLSKVGNVCSTDTTAISIAATPAQIRGAFESHYIAPDNSLSDTTIPFGSHPTELCLLLVRFGSTDNDGSTNN